MKKFFKWLCCLSKTNEILPTPPQPNSTSSGSEGRDKSQDLPSYNNSTKSNIGAGQVASSISSTPTYFRRAHISEEIRSPRPPLLRIESMSNDLVAEAFNHSGRGTSNHSSLASPRVVRHSEVESGTGRRAQDNEPQDYSLPGVVDYSSLGAARETISNEEEATQPSTTPRSLRMIRDAIRLINDDELSAEEELAQLLSSASEGETLGGRRPEEERGESDSSSSEIEQINFRRLSELIPSGNLPWPYSILNRQGINIINYNDSFSEDEVADHIGNQEGEILEIEMPAAPDEAIYSPNPVNTRGPVIRVNFWAMHGENLHQSSRFENVEPVINPTLDPSDDIEDMLHGRESEFFGRD